MVKTPRIVLRFSPVFVALQRFLGSSTDSQRPQGVVAAKLVLRFISGKYQGAEFPLADSPEIVGPFE